MGLLNLDRILLVGSAASFCRGATLVALLGLFFFLAGLMSGSLKECLKGMVLLVARSS